MDYLSIDIFFSFQEALPCTCVPHHGRGLFARPAEGDKAANAMIMRVFISFFACCIWHADNTASARLSEVLEVFKCDECSRQNGVLGMFT